MLPPGLAPKEGEPATPTDVDTSLLSRGVKAELRGVPSELAEVISAHLAAAAALVETDPAQAYAHAEAARRRAARLPITREAAGTTAYAAGEYAAALNEFRALRRMTGSNEFVAVMADCERGLGRPQAALKLVREGLAAEPSIAERIELRLVEAGARADLGRAAEAVRLLRAEIESVGNRGPRVSRARIRAFYAQLLADTGDRRGAEQWYASAERLDPENETGAVDALAALHGVVIEFDDSEDEHPEAGAVGITTPIEGGTVIGGGSGDTGTESEPGDTATESEPGDTATESEPGDAGVGKGARTTLTEPSTRPGADG